MLLLEHDAKALLAEAGIPVPYGIFATGHPSQQDHGSEGGWMVKAQITAGGRGKNGGIRPARGWAEVERETADLIGRTIGGHTVRAVRIERRISGAAEAYFSLSVAAAERGVRVMLSATGGVEIEALHRAGDAVRTAVAAPDAPSVAAAIAALADGIAGPAGPVLAAAGARLAAVFFARDLELLEINPLFVRADGDWCAGDARIIADESAALRQKFLRTLLTDRAEFYPEAARKAAHGFDYIVIDPAGEIGLVTTGAGLSMLLIDELRAAGLRPYNFLDVRSGGMHGDPARLVQVLRWIGEGPAVRVLFCNIFGGSTDLAAFAGLLVEALATVPAHRASLVIRLVGNRAEEARAVLAAAGLAMTSDLAEAVATLRRRLAAS